MDNFENDIDIPEVLPLLPIRDIVVFPFMVIPLFVGREISVNAVDEALSQNRLIFLSSQSDPEIEIPKENEIYDIGTIALILRMLKMPDGRVKILVQGIKRGRIEEFIDDDKIFRVKITPIEDEELDNDLKSEALIRSVKEQIARAVNLGKPILPDLLAVIDSINELGKLADIIASNLGLKISEAQEILEIENPEKRLEKVSEFLNKEISILEVQQEILSEAKGEIDKTQREYFLKEQLKAIRKELGDDDFFKEIEEFKEKIKKAKMPKEVKIEAEKQLKRLSMMHQDSSEATVVRTYLEWMVEIPWSKSTRDRLNIKESKKILDEDHYGLDEVKERILDFLAVRLLKKDMKSPILCFVGPPGVGKTSLGKSIARAMNRKFIRMSLGGVRDEAEIRGHRRTYIGALPGKIIQGIKTAKSNNPVFMLDEIDKLGNDFRGDPASALLEVLDPEQNNSFTDHFLSVPFNLRNVFFITTANYLDPIPPALLDRMEVIQLSGYTEEDKVEIAFKYLIPRQIEENGLTDEQISFSPSSVKTIVNYYTRESGLRNLERLIGTVCRKVARKFAEGRNLKYRVNNSNLNKFLGPKKYQFKEELAKDELGVVTGLAWTQFGGEILFIECTKYKGKGNMVLTGQLGNVMKESAKAAFTYIRSVADKYNINESDFSDYDIHIHVPAGATPKDGPSAGITIATAILSVFTGKLVKKEVAMTGEITITGNVLPIGGLKEKLFAAKRIGIKKVIVPKKNEKDLDNLPKSIKNSLEIIFVENFSEVPNIALDFSD